MLSLTQRYPGVLMSTAGPPGPDQKVAALSTLYQSEISANIGELQATTGIVLGQLAYLAATIFLLRDLDVRLLPLLPLGVIFASTYQMLRAAVVLRRAELARAYERRLAEVAGFLKEYDERKLGSPYYGALDDLGSIREHGGRWWWAKATVAIAAYCGLYVLVLGYTLLVLVLMWRRGDGGWINYAWSLAYLALLVSIAGSAAYLFRREPPAKL